jgi:hypothetical protein
MNLNIFSFYIVIKIIIHGLLASLFRIPTVFVVESSVDKHYFTKYWLNDSVETK